MVNDPTTLAPGIADTATKPKVCHCGTDSRFALLALKWATFG